MTSAADVLEADPATTSPRRRVLMLLVWVALGAVLLATELTETRSPEHRAARDGWWVLTATVGVLLELGVLFAAMRLARQFPIGRAQPARNVGPHALLWLAYTIAAYALDASFAVTHGLALNSVAGSLVNSLLTVAIWDGVAHGIEYLRRYRESEADALRLRVELADVARRRAEAELRALRAELNPRVLGDALDSVAALARTDPAAAERTLVQMGETMRAAIAPDATASPDASLEDELAALQPFLALQRARFGDRLVVDVSIDDDALGARVPHLMLQRLVGRAIDTAVAQPGPAEVQISGVRAEDRVRFADGTGTLLADVASGDRQADDATAPPPRRTRMLPAILGLWFTLWLATAFGVAVNASLPSGANPSVGGAMLQALLLATTLTAMLYVAVRLSRDARRFRVHAMAAVTFGAVIAFNKVLVAIVVGFPYTIPTVARLITTVVLGPLGYGLLSGVVSAIENARRYRASAGKALRLQAEVADAARRRAEAQLRALKAELNPHFLGNALAAAASLVHTDRDAAQRIATQLGATLRMAVARLDTQEVTLREEIDALSPFLEVERARLRDRLEVVWSVEDGALPGRVPHLILQPLVENAVKHGLVRGAGRIVVAAQRAGDRLELSVRDNGAGITPRAKTRSKSGGVGLTNIRARLEELYGSSASLELTPAPPPDTGTIARVSLPWREV